MSYHTWHEYGFGINPDEIDLNKLTEDKLFEFIHLAPEFELRYLDWLQSAYGEDGGVTVSEIATLEQMLEYETDTGYTGLGAIMYDVMNECEAISFYLCEDFDCRQYLMYLSAYPWNMSDADRLITQDSLRAMFAKYIATLQDEPITIDYLECENGG